MGEQIGSRKGIKEKGMAKLKMAIYFGDKPNTGEYDNGVWMHLLNIPFITRIEEAQNYDVIIRTLWIEATIKGWSKEIRSRFPAVKQIGLSDHALSTHISKLPADAQIAYLADLQYLDGIMALTEEERQWYQVAVPSIPIVKTGLPFPFEIYEARYGKFRNSEKKYIGLGVGASDNDRNFISSWLVFNRLKLEYSDIQGVFLSLPSQLVPQVSYLADHSKDIFLHERTDMSEFYDILSQCKFVINLADRNTPGRIQAEAAFLGVPVIGSNRLELQNELFPDLATSPYELETVVELARYLLINDGILVREDGTGTTLIPKAQKKLQAYNYRASKSKFNKLLKEIQEAG
jgi:hypothetical protein